MKQLSLFTLMLALAMNATSAVQTIRITNLQQGKRFGDDVLIEGTSNQVNQFGGYTGMRPADYKEFVLGLADKVNFPRERVILGGDHLGPLVWCKEPEESAMAKARDLVREYVLAGYKKIHLDTSMRLGDDSQGL